MAFVELETSGGGTWRSRDATQTTRDAITSVQLAFQAPDGTTLATMAAATTGPRGRIRLWDVAPDSRSAALCQPVSPPAWWPSAVTDVQSPPAMV